MPSSFTGPVLASGQVKDEGMTKCFVDDEIHQVLMMPPSLHDWLPEDHLARFVGGLRADEHPHYTTINEFRKRHLKALEGLFLQVLELCQAAGLVKMGHVALDGTKKQANASTHKALRYGRVGEAGERLRAQVKE